MKKKRLEQFGVFILYVPNSIAKHEQKVHQNGSTY